MSRQTRKSQRRAPDVKGPLAVSAVLALVAGGVTSFVAAGGTDDGMRLDLGLIVGGVAFIASVVVCATLMMLDKPNDPGLGEGSGVNRSSAKLYAERRAKRQSGQAQDTSKPQRPATPPEGDEGDEGPQYGRRKYPE
ncbi:hypothetical protein FCK90_12830 [Kocuria coralli]|uniref:Uncharacterized protein n=1 Tax=Kocuria coralli TaxID=1461025 RepID=A0A5J5KU01_9MICC|nr:hypothetical protein [Kocuria coralli]KAA9393267.1 hypothetical protein FCK90_12830 [Kocuria coralli]